MGDTLDPSEINAVVMLSDGQNEHTYEDLAGVARKLDVEDQRYLVRVFPIGFSEDADIVALETIAQGSGGATDPASIDRVMVKVLSSF